MNLPLIYNRQGGLANDGWIHIVPKGVLPNAEAKIDQVLDDAALDSILASLKEEGRRLGNRWPGLYIGQEHFIYDPEKSSEAFGWAKKFEKRADGIWAEPGWTDLGDEAIKNRRFKFTSFVADPRDLEPLGGGKYRVMRIETVGLTNFANGKHLLAPITNRGLSMNAPVLSEVERAEEFRHGLEAEAGTPGGEPGNKAGNQKKRMKTVATKLGLSADASEEAVLAEVTKIMNRAVEAEGRVTPLAQRVTALETENATLLGEQIDGDLAAHGIKDTKIINRLKPVLQPMKNRAERIEFLKDVVAQPAKAPTVGRVLNRAQAGRPETMTATGEGKGLTASQLTSEVLKIKNRDACTFEEAYNRLRTEKPELYE